MFWRLAGKGEIKSIDRTYSNPSTDEQKNVAEKLRVACANFFELSKLKNMGTLQKMIEENAEVQVAAVTPSDPSALLAPPPPPPSLPPRDDSLQEPLVPNGNISGDRKNNKRGKNKEAPADKKLPQKNARTKRSRGEQKIRRYGYEDISDEMEATGKNGSKIDYPANENRDEEPKVK